MTGIVGRPSPRRGREAELALRELGARHVRALELVAVLLTGTHGRHDQAELFGHLVNAVDDHESHFVHVVLMLAVDLGVASG